MKPWFLSIFCFSLIANVSALEIPSSYTELLDFVQPAPDQGETAACLYVGSTGAMELLANQKSNTKNPVPYGQYDLAETFLIRAPVHPSSENKSFLEIPVLKFNIGFGVHVTDWPFIAWENSRYNPRTWANTDWSSYPKVPLPKVKTIPLFISDNRWATNVLNDDHIKMIKEALWTYKSPVLVNYNDNRYWHVILIVGYDDELPGDCYQVDQAACRQSIGSFYVRDSFGVPVEVRDYDWFKIKGNSALVVTEDK